MKITLVLLILLGGCSYVNSTPGEWGPESKQDFSPRMVPGYVPDVGTASPQPRGIWEWFTTFPVFRSARQGYTPS